MFYKVIKNGKVIDVLDHLTYLKYQPKHDRMLLCDVREAQAFLSSDGKYAWHHVSMNPLPVKKYDTVELEEIDQYEYDRLKNLNGKTTEEVVNEVVLLLDKLLRSDVISEKNYQYIVDSILKEGRS